MKVNKDNIISFAMATLCFTNGVCPFCKQGLARDGKIDFETVKKHIDENDEWEKWEKAMVRSAQIV